MNAIVSPKDVILSEVRTPQSALVAQSKDPLFLNTQTGPRREFSRRILLAFAALFLTTLASAQTLTGTVKNSTTGKPASGDEVVLLSLGQGMEESGRTRTDANGKFSFDLKNSQGPHLVRAIHQEVTYHTMAPPGTKSVDVVVYDVGKKIEGISVVADIMRVQVEQGQLEIMRQFAVENTSNPPRTQMNERNLEFYVPAGAQIVDSSAVTEGGNPLNSAPVPVDDKKTRYAFVFPLRPGMTRFEVAYQLPYTGSANIDPRSIYPLGHFVALLPKSMQFTPAPGTHFELHDYPAQPDANLEVASQASLGQSLAFRISGEGVLQSSQENGGQQSGAASGEGGSAQGAENESRPGGGLGPPIDAPPPLQKYQWWVLGGFTLALVIGGVYVASRQQAANRAASRSQAGTETIDNLELDPAPESQYVPGGNTNAANPAGRPQTSGASMLLAGLKEELFQLEIDRQQGRITQEEYEKSKTALDYTLQRALKREAARES
jgi:hypothetical protein